MHIRFASASISSYIDMANGRSSLTRESPTHSALAKSPWHTNHIRPPSATWQSLHCFVLLDLLLQDAYPTLACNSGWIKVLDRVPTLSLTLRLQYMCTAATIEYSLSLGCWHYIQPLLITIQLVGSKESAV